MKHSEKICPSADMFLRNLNRTVQELTPGLQDIRPAIRSLTHSNTPTNESHYAYISPPWVRKNKTLNLVGIQESYRILKHAANISAVGSRKHTKSYHVRLCDLMTLYEDEDTTWRHYSYSDTKKNYLMNYVNSHLYITWLTTMSTTLTIYDTYTTRIYVSLPDKPAMVM